MRHETARIAGLGALAAALVTCAGPLYDDLAEVRTTVEAVEGDVVQVEDDSEDQLEQGADRVVEGTAAVPRFDDVVTVDATEPDPQAARVAFVQGVEYFDQGLFSEAAAAFRRSYRLHPHHAVLFNIAVCEAELGNHRQAIEAYERFIEQGGDKLPAERVEQVHDEIELLRKSLTPESSSSHAQSISSSD